MKLPRYPKHLFDGGHSGRRFGASDMPLLRELRSCYQRFLKAADALRQEESDPASLVALSVIQGELQAKFDACGRALSLLERTPLEWRP